MSDHPRYDSLAPGLLSLFGFGRRLVDVGISADIEEQLALRLRLCNGLAAVNVLVCLGSGINHWSNGRGGLALGLLLSAASWLGVFAANRLRLHRSSRLSVVVLCLGNILIYMGLLGSDPRLEVLCFAVSLLACFLFTLDDWVFWILALGLSSLVYGGGESTMRALFGPAPMPGATPPFMSVAVTFVELVLVAYLFAFESRRSFRALRRETRALEGARAEAQSAASSKSQFLATMSHELRTPLNGVVGMTQLLQLTRLDAEQREYLRTLAASSEYLMSLLDGVLDLNKLEAGRVDLENTTFQLPAAVESVASVVMDRGRQKGLKLGVQIDDDCVRWVSGDQRRLQQIIFNLVGNAVKFTERGSVSIRVSRTGEGPQAGWSNFEFAVEDTGIGMSDQELQQLFVPFRQANTSIARRFGGTGLGLAISHGLAGLMGGSLRCASRAGSGSKFVLSLGLEERPAPEKASSPARTPAPRREPLGLSVLLAEDNVVNQKVVSAFLKVLGCECEVVADGLQVLDRLRLRPFDVILMDCQMPELDGVSATLRIRQSGASYAAIPIVALTANVLDEERERCYAAGMNGYLTKPLARAKLHEELLRYVTHRSGPAAPSFARVLRD
jgi:signal transduction histidine kinase